MNEMKAIYYIYKCHIQGLFMISLLLFKLKFCPDLCSMVMVVNKVSPNSYSLVHTKTVTVSVMTHETP